MKKGDKQFVRAFFNIKALKRAFRAFYTYKFRIGILEQLERIEERLNLLERVHEENLKKEEE